MLMAGSRGRRQANQEAVNLDGETGISDFDIDPAEAEAGIRINNDGTVDSNEGASYLQIDTATDWLIPNRTVNSSEYWVRCTNNGDTLSGSSATGTWLDLSTTREWKIEQIGVGNKTLNLDIDIATDSGGSTIVASGTYSGSVSVTS